jgi:uncharacterized sulfatase
MVTDKAKVVVYSFWEPGTTQISPVDQLLEFYDYSTEGGRQDTANTPDDPRAREMANLLMNVLVPNEVRQPLPASLRVAQERARLEWIAYRESVKPLQVDHIRSPRGFPPGVGG